MAGGTYRRAFNTDVSGQVQGDVSLIAGQLEALILQRDREVKAAMADFRADGVSEDYDDVERRWNRASNETLTIVNMVQELLGDNDQTAYTTQNKARQAVQGI